MRRNRKTQEKDYILNNVDWTLGYDTEDYEIVPLDEYWLDDIYPFNINRSYDSIFKKSMEDKTPNSYSLLQKMHINSLYGTYGSSNSSNMWFSSMSGNIRRKSYEVFETAECYQKQKLLSHFKHTLKKTSKKKKEKYKTLTIIIERHTRDIEKYMDEYPERFI